ncbi:MAG: hypothetical protein MJZ95_04140 [Paludibacteraceae bacterium]|nr:hypothetical protein [Paludibacteraceae bacterium]
MPSCSVIPTKTDPSGQWYYTFKTWTPALTRVSGNATYKAVFDSNLVSYNIVWANYDGTQLAVDNLDYGMMPDYGSRPVPVHPDEPDGSAIYNFSGNWTPTIVPVVGEATYYALYDTIKSWRVIDTLKYVNCIGDVIILPSGATHTVRIDEVVKDSVNFWPYPGRSLKCDTLFFVDVITKKNPTFSSTSWPQPIYGTTLNLIQVTSDILGSASQGVADKIIVDSWWEIKEANSFVRYNGQRIMTMNQITLRFVMVTECGDTIYFPDVNGYKTHVKDANADNTPDCEGGDSSAVALYDWLMMINNKYLTSQGYTIHEGDIRWFRVRGVVDNLDALEQGDIPDEFVCNGFYLTIDQNFSGTGDYYALIDVRNNPDTSVPCLGIMRTAIFHYSATQKVNEIKIAPTHIVSSANVQLFGLDPEVESDIYVFDMAGKLINRFKSSNSEIFEFYASGASGCYKVMVIANETKTTLTYIIR